MINEISEGVKINFMDGKESDLEKKVRKLEKEMMELDNILNKEKLEMNKSMENQQSVSSDANNLPLFQDMPKCMAHGDGADSWQGMPINIQRYSTSSQVHPAFFFSWDCSLNDFQNNRAQKSINYLLDRLRPKGHPVSTDHFKKELSALLGANNEISSTTHQARDHHTRDDAGSTCEKLRPSIGKLEPDREKLDLGTKKYDHDIKVSEQDDKIPDLETKELLANLEKKLKQVESKCRDDARALSPITPNETETEDEVVDSCDNKTEDIDKDKFIIDNLIFEMFQDPHEELERKPIELKKEVDSLLKSYQLVGDSMCQKFGLKK